MKYTPDRWLILKITSSEETLYKVFASWSGGYLRGDSWKINSGIVQCSFKDYFFTFKGYSGSKYVCHKNAYGISHWGLSIIKGWQDNKEGIDIEMLPGFSFEDMKLFKGVQG